MAWDFPGNTAGSTEVLCIVQRPDGQFSLGSRMSATETIEVLGTMISSLARNNLMDRPVLLAAVAPAPGVKRGSG